jgi:hypothetical protein
MTNNIPFFNPFCITSIAYIHKNFIFVEPGMDQIKLYNILRTNLELSDDKAADFVSALGSVTGAEMNTSIQSLATKSDVHSLELKMHKAIFLSGVVQFIAIVASILASIKFIK